MWENVRILVVAKNRIKNRKNVRTTVARGARMILLLRTPLMVAIFRAKWPRMNKGNFL